VCSCFTQGYLSGDSAQFLILVRDISIATALKYILSFKVDRVGYGPNTKIRGDVVIDKFQLPSGIPTFFYFEGNKISFNK
jgi:hypothetical protein